MAKLGSLLGAVLLGGCTVNFNAPSVAGDWERLRGQGPMLQRTAEGIEFTFEGSSNPMYYIYRDAAPGFKQIVVDIDIQTIGTPIFSYRTEVSNTCSGEATVRPFFMSSDDWSAKFDRWWANPGALQLRGGRQQLVVNLQSDLWTSVYGRRGNQALQQWAAAIRNIRRAGLTFGGGCFFGHGVFVEGGTAVFRLLDFRLD